MTISKIVCISDTHNKHNQLTIPPCDLLLHAGDMTIRGLGSEYKKFITWYSQQPATHKIVIPGNHDYHVKENLHNATNKALKYGIHLLVDTAVEIEDLKIYGSPWQPWFHDWAWNFPQHDKIDGTIAKDTWAKIPDDTNILITHGPPHMILDRVLRPQRGEDPHVGCKQLKLRIDQLKQLQLHVFGHIHEAFGMHEENQITFVNASQNTLWMQMKNRPVVLEL